MIDFGTKYSLLLQKCMFYICTVYTYHTAYVKYYMKVIFIVDILQIL